MAFVIVIAIGAAIWIYADYQEKQKKAKTVVAFREELINAFPAHASELSEGIAAIIVADAYEKKGLAQKARLARDKFVKRKDHAEPEEKQSAKTKELGAGCLVAFDRYEKQFISRLPEQLQIEINNLPLLERINTLIEVRNRAWARVN